MKWSALLAATALTVACSATTPGSGLNQSDDDDGSSTQGNGGSGGGGFVNIGGNGSGGSSGDDCSDAAKLVYVLSDANELYSFDPPTKTMTKVGTLGCQTSMQPNSMAVDRNAVAWVNYVQSNGLSDSAGALYKVSTADASCEAAPAVNLSNGWFRVGMGFSTNGADTTDETLFVTGIGAGGLGRVDADAATVTFIGNFTGTFAGQNAELTGTGEGGLHAFFTTIPVQVAELDKSSAAVLNPAPLNSVEFPNAWAFSFWGGDFYLYTASLGNSRVNRYSPVGGTVDTNYVTDVGFRIVGAGVSTCAPVEQPK